MSMINQLGDPSLEKHFYVLSRHAGRNATEYVVMDRTTGARADDPAVFGSGSEAQARADQLNGHQYGPNNPAQAADDSPPVEPEPGSVVGFTKRFRPDGPGYAYVAIRIKGRGWFTTGVDEDPITWAHLLEFADGAQLWVTRDWTRL